MILCLCVGKIHVLVNLQYVNERLQFMNKWVQPCKDGSDLTYCEDDIRAFLFDWNTVSMHI